MLCRPDPVRVRGPRGEGCRSRSPTQNRPRRLAARTPRPGHRPRSGERDRDRRRGTRSAGPASTRVCLHRVRVAAPMKAAVIYENGGPDVLRYEDVADPECPEGCVVIDVEAISIEGGDLLARAGSPPPSVPHIVGYLAAGAVVEVGAGVEDRAAGDRVVTLNAAGSHASKRAVHAMSTWPIPDGLGAAAAACVPVAFGTAQECLFTAGNLQPGQSALIHAGAGGVGMAAIQLAKQAGATVISTASRDEKLERLDEFGLDHGINYARENFADRTRELTDGRGADV